MVTRYIVHIRLNLLRLSEHLKYGNTAEFEVISHSFKYVSQQLFGLITLYGVGDRYRYTE